MADGRRKTMPCGHVAEAVIGPNFYLCIGKPNCSGKPACFNCNSQRVMPFSSPLTPPNSMHCLACGKVWWNP